MSTDAEIKELREIVRGLEPSGPDGFEGLLAAVLTDILKVLFVLAKSGSQRGRDGDSSLSGQAIKFEAKLYNDGVPKDQVLSKLAEIAADEQGQTDLWILGSTGPVASQDVQTAKNFGRQTGVGVLIFDWSGAGLASLPTLLALAPEVAAKFLSERLGQDAPAVQAKIAAVGSDPQFADRSREVRLALSEPSLAPAYARSANKMWLRRAFENAKCAREVFGQPLAPGDAAIAAVLDRTTIRGKFANSLFVGPDGAIAALLGVDGSGKSWLFAQTWLAQTENILTLVLVPNDFTGFSREDLENLLISKCIVQTDDMLTEATKARWHRYFERWRRLATPTRPALIVFVDGINERNNLPWDRILDTLNGLLRDLHGKLAISCRTSFFRDRLEARLVSAVGTTDVPEWSNDELEQLLSKRGIALAKLNPAVASFLKNPRIFAVASHLLDTRQIEQIEELSVNRLLFEHIRSSDPGVDTSPAQFVRHVRDHADVIIERLQKRDAADLTIFDTFGAREEPASTWNSQFDAVSAGRFFEAVESDPTLYRLRDDGLPLALGLSLLSSVQRAERNGANLEEELSKILDPIAALDKTSDVLLAAVVAAILDSRSPNEVAAALVQAFVGLQNADSVRYPEFRALARSRPWPFLTALEFASLKERLTPNLSWLTNAIFEIRNEQACAAALEPHLHRWLNLFSDSPFRSMVRHGLSAEQQAAEYAQRKVKIDQALAALSATECKIYNELVHEDRGDYARLNSIAFRLLAGRPLAPFARSLRNWKFADGLNSGFSPSEEFRNLLTFNRIDWASARAALLKELEELNGSGVSEAGRWTRASLLRATGALDDAKEATALIEELTKDREKRRAWRLIENYCATDPCDPESERPANIDATAGKYAMIDFSKIHNAQGVGPEHHFFEGAMIGLARFEPTAAISGWRKLASHILTRDGDGFRYGVFLLEDHTSALDDGTAKKFVGKAEAIAAEALATDDKHRQLWMGAQFALLIAFPHMSGNEQLEALVAHPKDDNLSLDLCDAMISCDADRFRSELQRVVDTGDTSVQFKLLTFARCNGMTVDNVSKGLIVRLVDSPSTLVRIWALGLILRLKDSEMLRAVVSGGWTASKLNAAEHSFEIWYGSRVLVEATAEGLLSDEDCLERIALSAYPTFVRALGSKGAALVAKRLDAAIERASSYPIDQKLPEIEYRTDPDGHPTAYYLKDSSDPRETEVGALKRISEHAKTFFERQEQNQRSFDAFVRDLTRAGAELLIESVTDNLVSNIAAIDLPLVQKWHRLLMDMDLKALSQMYNVATLVAEAMSRHDPAASAALFERLTEASPIVRVTFGSAGLDLDAVSLWNAEDADAIRSLRFKRLDHAPNDNSIAVEVLAALRAGKEQMLRDYVADRVVRVEPSYVARAIMVAGFSNTPDWAIQTVNQFEGAHGFLGEAFDAAKYTMDRYRWSVHWMELLADATKEDELWRYAVILSKIVDGRFRYPARVTLTPNPLLVRYANSVEDLMQSRIKKWQDKRSKTLFGMDVPNVLYLT